MLILATNLEVLKRPYLRKAFVRSICLRLECVRVCSVCFKYLQRYALQSCQLLHTASVGKRKAGFPGKLIAGKSNWYYQWNGEFLLHAVTYFQEGGLSTFKGLHDLSGICLTFEPIPPFAGEIILDLAFLWFLSDFACQLLHLSVTAPVSYCTCKWLQLSVYTLVSYWAYQWLCLSMTTLACDFIYPWLLLPVTAIVGDCSDHWLHWSVTALISDCTYQWLHLSVTALISDCT